MKSIGASGRFGVSLEADRFLNFATWPSVVTGEFVDRLATIESICQDCRGDTGTTQHRSSERDAWINRHRPGFIDVTEPGEWIESNRDAIGTAFDSFEVTFEKLSHLDLPFLGSIDQASVALNE